MITAEKFPTPDHLRHLYQYMLDRGALIDIREFNPEFLKINSEQVLKDICEGRDGWEQHVPEKIARMIREQGLAADHTEIA